MAVTAQYIPQKMRTLLRDLTLRFYLPEEFPLRQYNGQVSGLLQRACAMNDSELDAFAASIGGQELDSLLLLLPEASQTEAVCIRRILQNRSNRRVSELLWPFFQYHFENQNVINAAKTVLENLEKSDLDRLAARNLRLFISGDGFDSMIKNICSAVIPLSIFAAEEQLLLDSPLAGKLLTQYFAVCGKEGFLFNEKRFLNIFSSAAQEDTEAILKNYLTRLEREEYLLQINLYILVRWGEPFKAAEWSVMPYELRKKFADWNSYRRLAEHFIHNKLKLRILNGYVPYILNIRLVHDSKYLAADFGDFVVVDDNDTSFYSYLISKSFYEEIADSLEKFSVEYLRLSKSAFVNARDFIIEESEDTITQLEYDELGKLYIRDMLNIVLRLSPDLRPSKSLINKKRKKKPLV